jgi:predicted TPR repeat methyltransferase
MSTSSNEDLAPAIACWNEGRLADAEALLKPMLAADPDHGLALQLLGAVYGQQGRAAEALPPLQRAATLQPDSASAHHNLGNVLAMLGRREEALASLAASLALQPANPAALMTQARTLMELHQPVQALRSIERAQTLEPRWALAWQCRGDVLALLIEAGMNRRDDAIAAFHRALELGGDAEEIAFSLAAIGEGAPPTSMPAQAVRALFDTYAPSFEKHLVESLNYRTPEHIGQMLEQTGLRGPLAEVWDLGCGTGLCAPLLRPLAQWLVGVDLSPGMLDVARARQAYDELLCADVVAGLQDRRADIDLLVAADVLIYIGDLQPMFEAARRALRPGGHFVFSVEAHEGGDYALLPTRRYAHAVAYLERLAAAHDFDPVDRRRTVLRENRGQAVEGWLLLLKAQPVNTVSTPV